MNDEALDVAEDIARQRGGVASVGTAHNPTYQVVSPEAISRVLRDNAGNYDKGTPGYQRLREVLGESLVTACSPLWERLRPSAQVIFTRSRVHDLADGMAAVTAELEPRWSEAARQGVPIDVHDEMATLALRVALRCLFDVDPAVDVAPIAAAVRALLDEAAFRIRDDLSGDTSHGSGRPVDDEHEVLDALADRILSGSSDAVFCPPDLLLALPSGDDDNGERHEWPSSGYTDHHSPIIGMLVAGLVTTAAALSWTWYLLSLHPEAQSRLDAELDAHWKSGPSTQSGSRLADGFPWLNSVINESLRLYPPIWSFSRRALTDDELCGVAIPAGSVLRIVPYVTHRDPAIWPDPERFMPERFDRASADQLAYSWIPFGAGPHACIGASFALQEMRIVIATLARRFRLHRAPGHPVERSAGVALQPKDGLWMTVSERP